MLQRADHRTIGIAAAEPAGRIPARSRIAAIITGWSARQAWPLDHRFGRRSVIDCALRPRDFRKESPGRDPALLLGKSCGGIAAANAQNADRFEFMNVLLNQLDKIISLAFDWRSGVQQDGTTAAIFFKFNESENPLAEVVYFGQRKINLGILIMSVGAIVAFGAGFVAPAFGAFVGGFLGFIATLFLLAGVTLAFVVPLLAFIKFFFNVLTWILSLVEAVVAVPLWALSHISPYGDGYMGSSKTGYLFIFNVFLRPVLMVFGLAAGLLLFMVGITLLNTGYEYAVTRSLGFGGNYDFFAKVAYSVIYAALVYICANNCFKGIDLFPSQALRWMGEGGQTTIPLGDPSITGAATGAVSAYMLNQGVGTLMGGGAARGSKWHEYQIMKQRNIGLGEGASGKAAAGKPTGAAQFVRGAQQARLEGYEQGKNDRANAGRVEEQNELLRQIARKKGDDKPEPDGDGNGPDNNGPRGGGNNRRNMENTRRTQGAAINARSTDSRMPSATDTARDGAASAATTANQISSGQAKDENMGEIGSQAANQAAGKKDS